ncbi:MAG: hypothetical protein QM535_12650 [Limnohabitans sp.]|nr:hypothetical protein [Limnohabitans sp.]
MEITTEKTVLEGRIAFLKQKKASDLIILKLQYQKTIDSFNPINLLKKSAEEFISTPNLKSILFNEIIRLGTSYLTKNVLNEHSTNPLKRILGKIVKFGLKNFIKKNKLYN